MPDPRDLILLTKAHHALAQAKTIDEVKDLRDKAAAVKAYAKKAKLSHHISTLTVRASIPRHRA